MRSKQSFIRSAIMAMPMIAVLPTAVHAQSPLGPVIQKMHEFTACIDDQISKKVPYLASVEICKAKLPNGAEINILALGQEGTGWAPNSNAPPRVVPSKTAFVVCADEAVHKSPPKNNAMLQQIIRDCDKYFPDCDCHVESQMNGELPVIAILPGRRRAEQKMDYRLGEVSFIL